MPSFGILYPTNDWDPEFITRIPESTAWNPESKTVMDSLTWREILASTTLKSPSFHFLRQNSNKHSLLTSYRHRLDIAGFVDRSRQQQIQLSIHICRIQ